MYPTKLFMWYVVTFSAKESLIESQTGVFFNQMVITTVVIIVMKVQYFVKVFSAIQVRTEREGQVFEIWSVSFLI